MKKYIVKGKIKYDKGNDGWTLETEEGSLTANLLTGIDEVIDKSEYELLQDGEEIEVTIILKDR